MLRCSEAVDGQFFHGPSAAWTEGTSKAMAITLPNNIAPLNDDEPIERFISFRDSALRKPLESSISSNP
jgi:hypothetical protein